MRVRARHNANVATRLAKALIAQNTAASMSISGWDTNNPSSGGFAATFSREREKGSQPKTTSPRSAV